MDRTSSSLNEPARGDDNTCNRFITRSAIHSAARVLVMVGGSPPNLRRSNVLSRTDDLALLMGRVFVAALFLPHGFHKLMTFWRCVARGKGCAIRQRRSRSGGRG